MGEANAIATEASYPYTARDGSCKSSFTTALPKGAVTGYKDVQPKSVDAMMSALQLGPVSIALDGGGAAFQGYKSGVLSGSCGSQLDHGVLAVGYGTLDGTDYWKVKNSWGASWGSEGYIMLAKGKNADGECGIKMQPSYPVVNGKAPPGPSPPPAPPSPPSPPPSPPSPSTSHYEKP